MESNLDVKDNKDLTENELIILLESRSKTIEEISDLLGISMEQVLELLDNAKKKISDTSVRFDTEDIFLPRPSAYKLEEKMGEPQLGTMKVGSQILEMLSRGIYTAPWNSLKELVSNSFDADAKKVEITYYPKENRLVICDDGIGMNYKDFDEHFTFIVKSEKRKEGEYTEIFKRPIIGKIGIGFIAVTELCNKMKITSSKKGYNSYFTAMIDFSKIMSEEAKDKEFYEVSQFTLTNYKKEKVEEHYTKIELLELKQAFKYILDNQSIEGLKFNPFYPSNFEKVMDKIYEVKNIKSDLGPFWEFIIHFSNTIPIEYEENGPINFNKLNINNKEYITDELLINLEKTKKIINKIKEKQKKYNFKVFFNGMELKKPVRLPHQEEAEYYGKDMILIPVSSRNERNPSINEDSVKYIGYFFYQRTRILPEEIRGLILRIKNVSIGEPSYDYWEHPYPGDSTYFPQVYGEIYVIHGLEDAMNIDRSTFKSTHPEFFSFKNELHRFLRKKVFQEAKNMYGIRRKEKSSTKLLVREESRNDAVKEVYGESYTIQETLKRGQIPVEIDTQNEILVLHQRAEQFSDYKKDDRLLLQDVALALEIAYDKSENKEELKNIFWEMIRNLAKYRI